MSTARVRRLGMIVFVKDRSGLKRALMSAWFRKPADDVGLRPLRDEILGIEARS
jgi:hypothetical protein